MRVWDYPKDTVTIKCDQCHREGHYPKERFVELVGRNTSLVEALRIIIKDCPRMDKDEISISGGCKAHYPDLI